MRGIDLRLAVGERAALEEVRLLWRFAVTRVRHVGLQCGLRVCARRGANGEWRVANGEGQLFTIRPSLFAQRQPFSRRTPRPSLYLASGESDWRMESPTSPLALRTFL